MELSCIAIDDEPLALGLVCAYIEQTSFLRLTGRFNNAREGLQRIQDQKTDVLFADIQMPDLNGIELARKISLLPIQERPKLIFTTAYNNFALEGYKVDAIDYLLKPFTYDEFLRAARKALTHYELLQAGAETRSIQEESLFLKVEYKIVPVPYKDILYIEGLKDYIKVHLVSSSRPILSLSSLKTLEQKLPEDKFIRVHRSFIISLNKIENFTRKSVTIGGLPINIGDLYKENLFRFLDR